MPKLSDVLQTAAPEAQTPEAPKKTKLSAVKPSPTAPAVASSGQPGTPEPGKNLPASGLPTRSPDTIQPQGGDLSGLAGRAAGSVGRAAGSALNFLDYGPRAAAANLWGGYGALHQMFEGKVPTKEAFEKNRGAALETTAVPESKTVSSVLGYIPGKIAEGVGYGAKKVLGEKVSGALEVPAQIGMDTLALAGSGKLAVAGPAAVARAVMPKATAEAVQKIFAPTSMGPEAGGTERIIRRATGEGGLSSERASKQLIEHNRLVANLPVADQRALVNYIENPTGYTPPPAPLLAAANSMRKVYDYYKGRIQAIVKPQDMPNFITDYYSHLWKQTPAQVQAAMGQFFSRQGSGRSFKKRSLPTMADGIAAGLEPAIENPIENTMLYAQNMSRYLATYQILDELQNQGYAAWYKLGKAPAGMVPLDGIKTEKPGARIIKNGQVVGMQMGQKLYAPENVARVFNNFISKGFERGDAKDVYQGIRSLSNGVTQLKLGLSAFHLATMTNEAIISEVARGFQAASRGDIKTALKAAVRAPANVALTLGPSYRRGLTMERQLLDSTIPIDALSKKVNEAFVRSGGQIRMDPFYRTRAAGSFFNALEKGTFKRELSDIANKLYTGTPWEKVKTGVGLVGNAIQTVAAPLFEKYIPRIKRGAFADRMADYLKSNPRATQGEIDQFAIKLQDSIDNRFGELVQDNLFWKKQMKQIAQISLLSATWDLGTVREIGGGIADIAPSMKGVIEGKGITDRTAYIAALASVVALENGIATYLKTGTAPQGRDYMAYRTGGTDVDSGEPERGMLPGYQKDVYAFGYDFPNHVLQESINKLNPGPTSAIGLLRNKDYRGLPIYRPEGATPIPGEPGVMDYLLETYMPISIGQLSAGRKAGSNISLPERLLAVRPAPNYITSPTRVEQLQQKYDTMDWRRRVRADQRQQNKMETQK